jgi:hypothetical protein
MLDPGSHLGPYEILAPLGAGGMGEVYRAHDTRLNRDVAVKVLPAGAGADPDRQSRFEQEARAAAALNHPNIVAVFDVGLHGGTPYIVTELLEGATVAERLREGPLPVRSAVDTAIQVARGLAAAHERNIVHRDLKPANVFLTADGRAKILDFGLAKLTQPLPALPTDSVLPTTPMGTTPGIAFGTVGYMAPEQVRGQAVDRRADIFAFGVLLYEMVSGARAFERETPPETLTAILREDVPERPLEAHHTPASLTRIIRRCVEKDPAARFQSALDLAFALEAIDVSSSGVTAAIAGRAAIGRRERGAWVALAAVAAVAVATTIGLLRSDAGDPARPPVVRFFVTPPRGVAATAPGTTFPALAPDGARIAFVAAGGRGDIRPWIQSWDQLGARPVPGPPLGAGSGAAAGTIFWAPDGGRLAFIQGSALKTIDVAGGTPRTVCDLPTALIRGGAWNADGVIVLGSAASGLLRCSINGGPATPLTELSAERRESGHQGPEFLPDGRRLLYWAQPSRSIWLASLEGGVPREIVSADSVARYVEPGYLVFARQGTLVAQPFDLAAGALRGEAVPVVEQVLSDPSISLGAVFDASQRAVVYRSGVASSTAQLTWVDRAGSVLSTIGEAGRYRNPSLSPDGTRVAVEVTDAQTGTQDVWIMEARGVLTRFTFDSRNDTRPLWSPDGAWIVFASDRDGVYNLYRKRSNGAGSEELLLKMGGVVPNSWTPDGASVVYQSQGPYNLGILSMAGTRAARPLDPSRAQLLDAYGQVSADGKWLAFASNESGRMEVYVQSFPSPDGGKWQVSSDGGVYPRWGAGGRELFYVALDGKLMSVSVRGEAALEIGSAEPLFEPRMVGGAGIAVGRQQQYAVAPDGRRFLINAPVEDGSVSPLTVVLNWQSLLEQ